MSIKTEDELAYNKDSVTAVCKHSHNLGHLTGSENFKVLTRSHQQQISSAAQRGSYDRGGQTNDHK